MLVLCSNSNSVANVMATLQKIKQNICLSMNTCITSYFLPPFLSEIVQLLNFEPWSKMECDPCSKVAPWWPSSIHLPSHKWSRLSTSISLYDVVIELWWQKWSRWIWSSKVIFYSMFAKFQLSSQMECSQKPKSCLNLFQVGQRLLPCSTTVQCDFGSKAVSACQKLFKCVQKSSQSVQPWSKSAIWNM